jgi:hypothetical protein
MPNLINAVKAIKKELQTGWPFGASEAYKRVPVLLKRIDELEAALAPFAATGAKNMKFVHPTEMTEVYMKDLIRALEFMDPKNSLNKIPEDFGLPAE